MTPEAAGALPRLSLASLREYLAERFPVPVTLVLSVAIAAAAYATAQGATLRAGAPLFLDGAAFGGAVMTFLFVFLLRVYDEHKDFEQDAATRPDRPVQRGVITLAQLRVLGAAAVAIQIALAVPYGAKIAAVYGVVLGYSVLMYFEFFAREWLSARLVWYALSHTVVMSLLALALGIRFTMRVGLDLPLEHLAFLALCLPSFFAIDVLRKMWAPQSEVDGVDSYTKRLGARGAAVLGGVVLVTAAVIAGWIGWRLGGRVGWLATVVVVTGWSLFELASFARDPEPRREKRLEMTAGVHLLVLFVGLAVVAGLRNGVEIGLGVVG